MKKQELSLDDRKALQLEMLREVDEFCRCHNIKYSLAYGTLLGAVRHKGYIPWDDDMDIMMPLPDLLRFKKAFHSENIKFCDIDTDSTYEYAFPRLCSLKTYELKGKKVKSRGLAIDLYPVLSLPDTKKDIDSFFEKANCILQKRLCLLKWRTRITKYLGISNIPNTANIVRRYRDFLFHYPYTNCNNYLTYGGGLHWRNVVDVDLFSSLDDITFENNIFWAISSYEYFLSHFYGDYMQLPPEDQRHPYHGGHYYWKNYDKI